MHKSPQLSCVTCVGCLPGRSQVTYYVNVQATRVFDRNKPTRQGITKPEFPFYNHPPGRTRSVVVRPQGRPICRLLVPAVAGFGPNALLLVLFSTPWPHNGRRTRRPPRYWTIPEFSSVLVSISCCAAVCSIFHSALDVTQESTFWSLLSSSHWFYLH